MRGKERERERERERGGDHHAPVHFLSCQLASEDIYYSDHQRVHRELWDLHKILSPDEALRYENGWNAGKTHFRGELNKERP